MNWLDIVIVLLVTLPTFFGFRKGFLRKLLGIAGIILGFILAVKFYDSLTPVLSKVIKENPAFVNVLSFLLIIGTLYGASIWLARFIANMNSGTSIIDKILGTAVGFLQGLLVASVLLYNLSFANLPSAETRSSSLLYGTVTKIAPAMFDKILEYFPGLEDLYREYKSPVPGPSEQQNLQPVDKNEKNNKENKNNNQPKGK
ncbi:MAG TPA: CvpA family protein [Ignavibacteria bacterium]|nr:CvpA family protein [Ignavibacteria bacterium]HMR00473.1 CvpA family protein [Ignavibacteria bacterium]